MRLIFAALLLAFTVFFTSIELSSQSNQNHSSQGSRRSSQRVYSGEPSISNEHEQSQDSANSRTSRRFFQQVRQERVEDSRNSASSSRRQQNANRARSDQQRSPSGSLEQHGASSSHREEGYPGHFGQEGQVGEQYFGQGHFGQGNFGQGGQQHQSDSGSHYSYISYSLPSSPSVPSVGLSSPRGPFSFNNDFNADSSESGSNQASPRHHHP